MTTTDKPSAEQLANAIEAKLKDPCGEYIIFALEGSVIVPALRRPPVAGAEVGVIRRCADIALAIDSGRGNEKEIAKRSGAAGRVK